MKNWLVAIPIVIVSNQLSLAEGNQVPPLPSAGFISGRAATEQDIKDGNAIFVSKRNGSYIGTPISVTIPQYAHWTDDHGRKVLVVIVQAEQGPSGVRLYGFRDSTGAETVVTEPEIELLGVAPPKFQN